MAGSGRFGKYGDLKRKKLIRSANRLKAEAAQPLRVAAQRPERKEKRFTK